MSKITISYELDATPENIEAVNALVIGGKPAKKKPAPTEDEDDAPKKKTTAKKPAPAEDEEDSKPAKKSSPYEEIVGILSDKVKTDEDEDTLRGLLKKFGATNMGEVDADDLPALLKKVKAAFE